MKNKICPNGALCVMAPPQTINAVSPPRRFNSCIKDGVIGLMIALFAVGIAFADELPQGWVPEMLSLPSDAEVTMERAIGSSIRMFSFKTQDDIGNLFDTWSEALDEDGYTVRAQPPELDGTTIEFSGHDILNAKIATEVVSDEARPVITFDATLR
ncbi:hypothetical protein [Yoonia sp.]|uniref:hypothetical protein n=1 Tax=Yoonia sp. TaxID=2212373 RepID=UPI0039753611